MLTRKVHAFNEAQRVGHAYALQAIEALKPLIGQKVIKADGTQSLALKRVWVNDTAPVKPYMNPWHPSDMVDIHTLILQVDKWSVWLKVTIRHGDGPHGCFYTDYQTWIGNVENQELSRLQTPENLEEPMFTSPEEQEEIKRKVLELQDQLRILKKRMV